MDLLDESFYIVVPWRWAVGDRPFVDEMNLLQIAAFLTYPFVKGYVWLSGGSEGLILFMRRLYVAFNVLVAAAVVLGLRRLVRWQYAVAIGAVYVTFVPMTFAQLSYNTMGAGFLSIGIALGLLAAMPEARGRRWSLAAGGAGLAHGLAVVAYPTFVLVLPVYAACLLLAIDGRLPALISRFTLAGAPGGASAPPAGALDQAGTTAATRPRGFSARRVAWAYSLAAAAPILGCLALVLWFGWGELGRIVAFQRDVAASVGQLGGFAKAEEVGRSVWRIVWSQPLILLGAAVLLLLGRYRPKLAGALLLVAPVPLYLAGQRPLLGTTGFAIVYGLGALYLFVFAPAHAAHRAARLLVAGALPALVAALVAGYSSAAGFVNSAVGFMAAFMVSGVLLVWAAAAEPGRPAARVDRHRWWMVMVSLAGIVAATMVFQIQTLPRGMPYSDLSTVVASGPYRGLKVIPERAETLARFERDITTLGRPQDRLLVFYQAPGYYLYWPFGIASDSVWISSVQEVGVLPQATRDWYRRTGEVPDLVVRLVRPGGLSDATLETSYLCGLTGYEVVLRRPDYVFLRRQAGVSDAAVIDALP